MRSSLRRVGRCWEKVGVRYTAYLQTLNEDEFAAEFRRMYVGFTREQMLELLGINETTKDRDDAKRAYDFADKVFEGRDRL